MEGLQRARPRARRFLWEADAATYDFIVGHSKGVAEGMTNSGGNDE